MSYALVLSGDSCVYVTIIVTNGAIVIHTQRLKSDPGGNLLS
ncbi:chemotaxis protein [Yersinia pestis]|nr:chemotaxis protein [Yersinia pestis]